jgi:hypothetical protein
MSPESDSLSGVTIPLKQRGASVTDAIRQVTTAMNDTNDNEENPPKCPQYLKFTPDQLSQLILACSNPTISQTLLSVTSPTSIVQTF